MSTIATYEAVFHSRNIIGLVILSNLLENINVMAGIFELNSFYSSNAYGFLINGTHTGDGAGTALGCGDINGDGKRDLLIGAYGASPLGRVNAGQIYVIFGTNTTFSPQFELSSLNGTNGFTLAGTLAGDNAGLVISTSGDLNGDGIADLLIGAPNANPNGKTDAGIIYIVFGRPSFNSIFELSSLNGSNGFAITGVDLEDHSGHSVAYAGDINNDGKNDIAIGAYGAGVSRLVSGAGIQVGEAYVVFGRSMA